jgi:hypothetical protein
LPHANSCCTSHEQDPGQGPPAGEKHHSIQFFKIIPDEDGARLLRTAPGFVKITDNPWRVSDQPVARQTVRFAPQPVDILHIQDATPVSSVRAGGANAL